MPVLSPRILHVRFPKILKSLRACSDADKGLPTIGSQALKKERTPGSPEPSYSGGHQNEEKGVESESREFSFPKSLLTQCSGYFPVH